MMDGLSAKMGSDKALRGYVMGRYILAIVAKIVKRS